MGGSIRLPRVHFFNMFPICPQAVRSSHCFSAVKGHTTHSTGRSSPPQSTPFPILPPEQHKCGSGFYFFFLDGVIFMLVQPFSSVIVPVPPEKKPSVQFSAATMTNCTAARVKMTIVLSADASLACHASCSQRIVWEDGRVTFCCFILYPHFFFLFFFVPVVF